MPPFHQPPTSQDEISTRTHVRYRNEIHPYAKREVSLFPTSAWVRLVLILPNKQEEDRLPLGICSSSAARNAMVERGMDS